MINEELERLPQCDLLSLLSKNYRWCNRSAARSSGSKRITDKLYIAISNTMCFIDSDHNYISLVNGWANHFTLLIISQHSFWRWINDVHFSFKDLLQICLFLSPTDKWSFHSFSLQTLYLIFLSRTPEERSPEWLHYKSSSQDVTFLVRLKEQAIRSVTYRSRLEDKQTQSLPDIECKSACFCSARNSVTLNLGKTALNYFWISYCVREMHPPLSKVKSQSCCHLFILWKMWPSTGKQVKRWWHGHACHNTAR